MRDFVNIPRPMRAQIDRSYSKLIWIDVIVPVERVTWQIAEGICRDRGVLTVPVGAVPLISSLFHTSSNCLVNDRGISGASRFGVRRLPFQFTSGRLNLLGFKE